jgi:hypothetical protein
MMKIARSKKYFIKEISDDGLIKDVIDYRGDRVFDNWGYDSEEEAWLAIEKDSKAEWEASKSGYNHTYSYIVVCEWQVSCDDT